MTPKTELFGRIEEYCLELLDAKEKLEFEQELEINEELRAEVELHKNIQAAVTELDILNLRGKLDNILDENKPATSIIGSFEILDELIDFQEVDNELTPDELINSFESLPKVHVYQNQISSKENIHPYYKEQETNVCINGPDEDLGGFDMDELEGMEGLEEAILEKDILNLRENLQHIAKSIEPQYSVEEIDGFLNGELSDDILAEFELEFDQNEDLQAEVNLHKDIESAVYETDIMDLRSELRNIMESETSWNVSEQNIEDFIDEMLEEDLLEEFNAELKENTDLMAEVALRKNINSALAETDVQSLREKLKQAKHEVEKKEVKSIVMPRFEIGRTRFWRNGVAAIVILVGLSGALNTGMQSANKSYDKYFNTPSWASERSVTNTLNAIQTAKVYYQAAEYDKVIEILGNTEVNKDEAFVAQFYKGLSYQNLNNYEKAINEYSKVIAQGSNLFVEEAEWYKSLCYLKMNNKIEAKRELLAVIERRGHYANDAKAILRRLRYSFKL